MGFSQCGDSHRNHRRARLFTVRSPSRNFDSSNSWWTRRHAAVVLYADHRSHFYGSDSGPNGEMSGALAGSQSQWKALANSVNLVYVLRVVVHVAPFTASSSPSLSFPVAIPTSWHKSLIRSPSRFSGIAQVWVYDVAPARAATQYI